MPTISSQNTIKKTNRSKQSKMSKKSKLISLSGKSRKKRKKPSALHHSTNEVVASCPNKYSDYNEMENYG